MRRSFRPAITSPVRLLVLTLLAAAFALTQAQLPARAAGSPPPQPLGLEASANANGTISLDWDVTPGATSYRLYRGTAAGGEGSTPIATLTSPEYTDTSVTSTPIYFYEVSAVNANGESPLSAEDASKTPPPIGTGGTTPGVASGNSLIFYGKDSLLGGFDWFQTLTGWFPQVLGSSGANTPTRTVIDMAYADEGSMTFNNVVVPAARPVHPHLALCLRHGLVPRRHRPGNGRGGERQRHHDNRALPGDRRLRDVRELLAPGAPERRQELGRPARRV